MARPLRSFTEMLGLLARGAFAQHLNRQLTEAVEALDNAPADKCKAEINLKIIFDYELGRIDIKPESKLKLPDSAKFSRTPFWAVDGALSLEHPNQIDMFPARAAAQDDAAQSA